MKLNLGCGGRYVPGWVNVDYAIGARIARTPVVGRLVSGTGLFGVKWDARICLHDLRRRLPWNDGDASVAYASHTLEHLSRSDGVRLLEECHRVLRPGGIVRILVPDLDAVVRSYQAGRLPADEFVEALGVLYEHSPNPIKNRLYPFIQFPHKCMYNTRRLLEILEQTGFRARSCAGFESAIDAIDSIEIADRTIDAVIVEGIRV